MPGKVIVSIIAISLFISPYLVDINGFPMYESAIGGNSLHIVAHGNWCALKFNALEPIVINELSYKISFKEFEKTRTVCDAIFITNFSDISSEIFGVREGVIDSFRDGELFFHLNFDGINFTINHLNLSNNFSPMVGKWWSIHVPRGIWYLIFIVGAAKKCEIEFWMNVTGNVVFEGVTEGNDTFLLSSHEIQGTLNFIIPYVLGAWSLRKTFIVNHTFVGSVMGWSCDIKVMHLAITLPSGETKHSLEIFQPIGRRGWVTGDMSPFFFCGGAGKWRMRMDAFMIQFRYDKRFTPWLGFLGADIKLP